MKICFAILLFLSGVANAADDQLWNWYVAGFNSPSTGSGVFVREGTARVEVNGDGLKIHLYEQKRPELDSNFIGKKSSEGNVEGRLNGFFPVGDDDLDGRYTALFFSSECKVEEIVLRFGVPDGTVLAISRTIGRCQ
jgi:hypothetical protein